MACHAGAENEMATPTTSEATMICQTLSCPVRMATARKSAESACAHCDALTTRRRSKWSATTPPGSIRKNDGMELAKPTKPRRKGESVRR